MGATFGQAQALSWNKVRGCGCLAIEILTAGVLLLVLFN